jgi:two-component system, NarL family, nitrate/nitrite response regulator NarL
MSNRDSKVTVLIVDDHAFFRDGLSRGLTRSGQIAVVAEAGNGREGLEAIRRERPAVAVVDYQMPDMDGIALLHAVTREQLATRVVLLSAFTDSAVVFRALEEGAAGYLSKDADRQDIVDAVLSVARGDTVVPAPLAAGLAGEIRLRARSQAPALSTRERQVLQAFSRGLSIPQTATELYIEPSTVKTHTQRLYDKLGVSDRAAAVAEGMRRGLLE